MLRDIINKFFDDFMLSHHEYMPGNEGSPKSPHKPLFEDVETTADEEYRVYKAIETLTEKELEFLDGVILKAYFTKYPRPTDDEFLLALFTKWKKEREKDD